HSARLSSTIDVFSMSSRAEDDEEALKWAAIRRGILSEQGQSREVDITDLGLVEKRNLLERLVKIAEEDNEKFLLKLKQRIDRVGLDLPRIEVRFDQLSVDAETNVGNRGVPTIFNFTVNILEGFLNSLPNTKRSLPILHEISGIVKPGRMTLLLGPPGSGKTTLLLALAGKLDRDHKNWTAGHFLKNYVEMLAELSVREKEADIKPDPDVDIFMKAASIEGQDASVVTDYILKILGLDICADTPRWR
ncbi:hypothetical protein MTR67_027376, partial [Solanum verrucosum]